MTNKQRVLDAVIDLHNQEQIVTRETLSDVLDLKQTIIDDNLSSLVNDDLIHRVQRGVYVPTVEHKPARIISKIVLPCGTVKIDIGDDMVVTLTPKEARLIGSLFMADAMQYSNIEIGHHAALTTAKMDLELKQMRKQLRELSAV
ncbi:hypothetical protein CXF60_06140 [Psychrobacter sp. 4Bb]|nr:hypothetical protein [Psychrobacter sp. 4Bb]PKH81244.1 hypothetical protein CXF60_06140 [Psychrobacter sp. 4Bb]